MNSNKHYGYQPDEIAPEDYVFGSRSPLRTPILQPDGQWDAFLPAYEAQNVRNIETMACTSYNTLTALEALCRRLQLPTPDFSERFTAIGSKTDPLQGNSPHKVIEFIRKNGLIPENLLPFDGAIQKLEDYYSPDPLPYRYRVLGQQFIYTYKIGHEYVPTNPQSLMEALRHSPLGISVFAWKERDGLYYKDKDDIDNHWTCLYGFEQGKHWKIRDSYDGGDKKLEWDYDFGQAKAYTITENSHHNWLIELYKSIFRK